MFEAADRNKDGSLNKHEFIMFSHPEEHPDMLPLILKQTLQEKDTDGDGFINFQEYIGDRGKLYTVEFHMLSGGWECKAAFVFFTINLIFYFAPIYIINYSIIIY